LLDEALGQELFRRLDPSELAKALSPLDTLDFTRVEEKVPHLKSPNFSDPFFLEERWIEKVLYLTVKGLLTAHESAKLFLYRAIQEVEPSHQLLQVLQENGTVDEAAWDKLKAGMKNEYTEHDLNLLLDLLKKLPPTETQFFLHKRIYSPFLSVLTLNLNHTLFYVVEKESTSQYVIPPALAEELYRSKWGDQTVKANPVFGLSTPEDFDNPDIRDVYIPCSLWNQPTIADNHLVDPLEFYHHDAAYHLWRDSTNPYRELFARLAHVLLKLNEPYYANKMRDRDVDFTKAWVTEEQVIMFLASSICLPPKLYRPLLPTIRAYDREKGTNLTPKIYE
jgi:hypothetical protein